MLEKEAMIIGVTLAAWNRGVTTLIIISVALGAVLLLVLSRFDRH